MPRGCSLAVSNAFARMLAAKDLGMDHPKMTIGFEEHWQGWHLPFSASLYSHWNLFNAVIHPFADWRPAPTSSQQYELGTAWFEWQTTQDTHLIVARLWPRAFKWWRRDRRGRSTVEVQHASAASAQGRLAASHWTPPLAGPVARSKGDPEWGQSFTVDLPHPKSAAQPASRPCDHRKLRSRFACS